MVDMKMVACVVLVVVVCTSCVRSGICYASSSAEIAPLAASGNCDAIIMRDVNEATMRFSNDDPSVSVYVDIDYSPAVRRVEADGRGYVSTSGIEEVVRTNTNCLGSASSARLLDFTVGDGADDKPNFCNFSPEPGSFVHLAAEDGVIVDFMVASSRDWSTVTLEIEEAARPVGALYIAVAPLEILQKFGSQMKNVQLNRPSDEELSVYFAWLDSEGYDGTVHVNSDDGQQTPVQVYPAVQ